MPLPGPRAAHQGPLLAIVMPAYDELPNLRVLLPAISAAVASAGIELLDVIVVVRRGSGSFEEDEVRRLGGRPVRRRPGDTFGDAMRTGLAAVPDRASLVLTMDADGSHDPWRIPDLVAGADQADIVVASRYITGGRSDNSLALRAMSRVLNRAGDVPGGGGFSAVSVAVSTT